MSSFGGNVENVRIINCFMVGAIIFPFDGSCFDFNVDAVSGTLGTPL
jgi:hypothetical protein